MKRQRRRRQQSPPPPPGRPRSPSPPPKKKKLNDNYIYYEEQDLCGLMPSRNKSIEYSSKCNFKFHFSNNPIDCNNWIFSLLNYCFKIQKGEYIINVQRNPTIPYYKQNEFIIKKIGEGGATGREEEAKDDNNITYNAEQLQVYNNVTSIIDGERIFTIVCVNGKAGSGKTVCLKQFCNNKEIQFLYIAQQHTLLEETKYKLNLNPNNVMTLTKFIITLLNINYYQYLAMCNNINSVPTETLKKKNFFSLIKAHSKFTKYCLNFKKIIICIDEYSMVNSNIIVILQQILTKYAKENGKKIVLLLCGDKQQIQPILITKTINTTTTININSHRILEFCDTTLQLTKSMRNPNKKYDTFLKNFLHSKRWYFELEKYFEKIIFNRQIDYHYPINVIIELYDINEKYILSNDAAATTTYHQTIINWYRRNQQKLQTFLFFSYTNIDSHFVNLSLFYSISRTIDYEIEKNQGIDDEYVKKLIKIKPLLSPILFTPCPKTKITFNGKLMDRLPLLPIILGLPYKYLLNVPDNLCRNQRVILLYYNNVKNNQYALVMDDYENLYLLQNGYFKMNLFCDVATNYTLDYFNPIEDDKKKNVQFIMTNLKNQLFLYGMPLQLFCASTLRSSIGLTTNCPLYGNLNGASIEEIYVFLSRTTNEKLIKGILLR